MPISVALDAGRMGPHEGGGVGGNTPALNLEQAKILYIFLMRERERERETNLL